MSKGRKRAHLLHLGDKLFAIGGKHTSLIEVFEHGVWTPICTENPPDIDPYFQVSATIEDANFILIGSKGSFYLLDVMDAGNETLKSRWNKLLGECPSKLLDGCFKQPGIVTKNHYVLWYDDSDLCIYGLNPFSFKCFRFNLVDDIFGPAVNSSDIRISKLIDLGEGILCFIYAG
ncbi:hypothetical protein LIER_08242 [Lithospermum erythrorhizon]|uniref:F-box protein n=1 Tax=Lithospermum erythrorhizon TaxID=34254 RepID=A0AAV3PCB8_LITER